MAFLNLMQNRLKPKEVNEALLNGGLPAVTAEDNGDVLTVVEGAWAKAELPNELPAVTSADEGDVLAVNSSGAWAKTTPTKELPAVTSADEGDVLAVNSSGAWAKSTPTKELPAVTAGDDGDVLTVVSGAWAKATPSTPTVPTILHGSTGIPEMGSSYTYYNATITFGVTLPSNSYDILLSFAQYGDAGQPGSQNMNYIISGVSTTGFMVSVSSDGTSPAGALTWMIIQNPPAVQSKRAKKETNK